MSVAEPAAILWKFIVKPSPVIMKVAPVSSFSVINALTWFTVLLITLLLTIGLVRLLFF